MIAEYILLISLLSMSFPSHYLSLFGNRMEELQVIKKSHQIPEDLRQKRRLFNNKRFHTSPCQGKRTKRQVIDELASSVSSRNPSEIFQLLRNRKSCKEQLKTQSKMKKRGGKLQNIWEKYEHKHELKTCKSKFKGYEKRKARIQQNSQTIGFLFRDTTKIVDRKSDLLKNISVISTALRDSLPKMKMDQIQFDEFLVMPNSKYKTMFHVSVNKIR